MEVSADTNDVANRFSNTHKQTSSGGSKKQASKVRRSSNSRKIEESAASSSYAQSGEKVTVSGKDGKAHISVSGMGGQGGSALKESSQFGDNETEEESESMSLSQTDASKQAMWAKLREKYLSGGLKDDDDDDDDDSDDSDAE